MEGLSRGALVQALTVSGLRVELYGEVDSTNTLVRQAAEAGAPEGLIVIASAQRAGRGRRGRSFYSPQSSGLYMSALLRPKLSLKDSSLITTLAAVSVAEAAESVSGRTAAIKWVNDVFMDGRKAAGILTESVLSAETGAPDYAVLGIGVNLTLPQTGVPESLAHIMGAVFRTEAEAQRMGARLAGEIWSRFFSGYRRLPETDFLDAYRARSFLIGKPIEVLRADGAVPATALAVDEHAGLVVRYADGREETLSSGEVSVRRSDQG